MSEVTSTADVKRALAARGLEGADLRPIGVRPSLASYIQQLWERRHFIWMDASRRAATQNLRNRLGNVWLFLRPMVDAAFYFLIFGIVLNMHRDVENFPAFVVIGILTFRYTSQSISSGASALSSQRAMIRAFTFPRASIPISQVLSNALTAVITTLVMCCMIAIIPPFALPQATWPLLIPIFLLQCTMNLGITFFTARLGFHFPDMSQVMTVISRFLMYGSGVIFPITRFVEHPYALAVLELNPLYQIIDMLRTVLIAGEVPGVYSWSVVVIWTGALLIGGFIYFWRGEANYGRELR